MTTNIHPETLEPLAPPAPNRRRVFFRKSVFGLAMAALILLGAQFGIVGLVAAGIIIADRVDAT